MAGSEGELHRHWTFSAVLSSPQVTCAALLLEQVLSLGASLRLFLSPLLFLLRHATLASPQPALLLTLLLWLMLWSCTMLWHVAGAGKSSLINTLRTGRHRADAAAGAPSSSLSSAGHHQANPACHKDMNGTATQPSTAGGLLAMWCWCPVAC